MSEEQAHHISENMMVNVEYQGNTYRLKVSEQSIIITVMEKFFKKANLEFKQNFNYFCGGVFLEPNFTFGFYKAQFHIGGAIFISEKVSTMQAVAQIAVLYKSNEISEIIKMLQEQKDIVEKEELKEQRKFMNFLNRDIDNRRHYAIRKWQMRMAKEAKKDE